MCTKMLLSAFKHVFQSVETYSRKTQKRMKILSYALQHHTIPYTIIIYHIIALPKDNFVYYLLKLCQWVLVINLCIIELSHHWSQWLFVASSNQYITHFVEECIWNAVCRLAAIFLCASMFSVSFYSCKLCTTELTMQLDTNVSCLVSPVSSANYSYHKRGGSTCKTQWPPKLYITGDNNGTIAVCALLLKACVCLNHMLFWKKYAWTHDAIEITQWPIWFISDSWNHIIRISLRSVAKDFD